MLIMDFATPSPAHLALAVLIAMPSCLWLFGLLRWRRGASGGSHRGSGTTGSIGVAVVGRNEEESIAACLNSVLSTTPVPDDVLFTDDHSSDRTRSIAEEIAAKNPRLRVTARTSGDETVSPKKEALAAAFRDVQTELIAVTDADCVVPSAWIACLRDSVTSQTGAVLGASWPQPGSGLAHRIYSWERLIANSSMASACGWGYPASACGHSILYSRKALLELDAPVHRDLRSGDDDLTVQAIARAGYEVTFCADPRSVVREAGARGSRTGQMSRHQSVIKYYPLRWRLLYAASAITSLIAPLVIVLSFSGYLPALFGVCGAVKILADWYSGLLFARQLKIDLSGTEILCGAVVLPFWMAWRIVAHLLPAKNGWRGREYKVANVSLAATKR